MIYGSVCSGIEAATVAWGAGHGGLGWEAAWFAEIKKYPSAVLAQHYPDVDNRGDFTRIKNDIEPGTIDLLVGGTPCQSFSVAGLRGGLADDRGNLALQFLALAACARPEWVVWENVPGVLSSGGGRDIGIFLGALGELGYGWAYRVLDAQYFGVPQRRRRVFVVGCLGGWAPAAAVLFERESLRRNSPPSRKTGAGVAALTESGAESGGKGGYAGWRREDDMTLYAIQERAVSNNLNNGPKGKGYQEGVGYTLEARNKVQAIAYGGNNTGGPIDTATAVNAHGGAHGRQDFESETFIATTLRGRDGAKGVDSDATDTLVSWNWQSGGDVRHGFGLPSLQSGQTPAVGVRRLTPRECERLQGFPDDYTRIPWRGKPAENCPDGPRYKALGNSMAVPVMRWIGERIEMVERALDDAKGAA